MRICLAISIHQHDRNTASHPTVTGHAMDSVVRQRCSYSCFLVFCQPLQLHCPLIYLCSDLHCISKDHCISSDFHVKTKLINCLARLACCPSDEHKFREKKTLQAILIILSALVLYK